MPNKKSGKKELRKSRKRSVVNVKIKTELKSLVKKSRAASAHKTSEAPQAIAQAAKALDKAAGKGKIKPNKANRLKSRLQKQLNQTKK